MPVVLPPGAARHPAAARRTERTHCALLLPAAHDAGAAVDAAVAELRALAAQLPPSREGRAPVVAGIAANVAKPAEVAALADFAKQQLGEVDLWIK